MKLPKPWTPLYAKETEDGARLSVFGRTYTATAASKTTNVGTARRAPSPTAIRQSATGRRYKASIVQTITT